MQTENQSIDILLAIYNGALYLNELLASIELQTYKKWRLIIRDDCSSDNSFQIAKEFQSRHGRDKILLYKNDNPTGSAKMNFVKLIKDAQSSYIMFCDQDDIWHPDKIEITIKKMKEAEKKPGSKLPILIHTDLKVVDQNVNMIYDSFQRYMNLPKKITLEKLLIQNSVTGCTVMINAILCNQMKQIDHAEEILMHDYWAALIACVFGKICYIDTATIDYRQHGNNNVGAANARSLEYFYLRFKRGKKAFKADMEKSIKQIQYFYQLYQEKISDIRVKEMLKQYSILNKQNKISRIAYYFKFRVFKHGVVKKIIQIVWG